MPRKKRGLDLPGMRTTEAPAQLWKRVVAFIIDLLVIFFIMSPINKYSNSLIPSSGFFDTIDFISKNPEINQTFTFIGIMGGVLILLYFSILDSKIGQTLGKYLLGIYTKSENKNNLSFWRCLFSNITFVPLFPFSILLIIDPIHMFFSAKNQRLMQKFTKIVVMQKYVI